MSVYEKVKELLRTVALQEKWIRLAKLYIAWLETELKEKNRIAAIQAIKGKKIIDILLKHENTLSDGYYYYSGYTDESVEVELQKISKEILLELEVL